MGSAEPSPSAGIGRQQACSFAWPRGRSGRIRYLLYRPRDHGRDGERRWPLILFLHGAAERGDDLEQVKRQGLARRLEELEDFPFVVVSPQCPARSAWHLRLAALRGLLDAVIADHSIDADRVYLTGLSMGGFGVWHLAAKHPDRFAALVPICGGGLASQGFPARVCALREVPVWAFHGAEDEVVPLSEATALVETLKACGGTVQLTVYPGVGHDAWTPTYANPRLFEWLLEQRRPARP